jgi:hypothetical protein
MAMTITAEPPAATDARPASAWHHPALAAAAVFVGAAAQRPTGAFVYDASTYWSGSTALYSKVSTYTAGGLATRGALSPLVYAPAALVDRVFPGCGREAVLLENAVLLAVLGAVVLPLIARSLGARGPLALWTCAALTWFVGERFAPYALMDLPTAAVFLGTALFASTRSMWGLALAGLGAGIAANLRPAYLAPAGVVLVGVAVLRRLGVLAFLAGAAVALLPQVFLNASHGNGYLPTPAGTQALAGFQADVASYTVKYDTIVTSSPPQQYYCDPRMARLVDGHEVHSSGGYVALILEHPLRSVPFLAEKLSTALAWSWNTPYGQPAGVENPNAALPVVALTVLGLAALLLTARRGRDGYALLVLLAALATCVSLLTSATETRFALPVVLFGVCGCAVALTQWLFRRSLLVVGAVTALVLLCAAWGLSSPLPPGQGSAHACATVGRP